VELFNPIVMNMESSFCNGLTGKVIALFSKE